MRVLIRNTLRSVAATVLSLSCLTAAGEAFERPQQDYILNCQGCHLADGSGSPGNVPRMKNFVGWYLHVPGGREYIMQVPGVANAPLGDAQLAAVMNWVLQRFSAAQLPKDFLPYSTEETGRLRADSIVDVVERRAELLERIRRQLGVTETAAAVAAGPP